MLGDAASRVNAGTMTKTMQHDVETMSGFNWNPHGMVASAALCSHASLLDVLTYDWVHSSLQSGVLNAEIEAMLSCTGVDRLELHTFLEDTSWRFPRFGRTKAKALHRVFDQRRWSEDGKVKASCSELVGVYGMLRFFFRLKLDAVDEFSSHLRSFDAACAVIDLLLHVKRGMASADETASQLVLAQQAHLSLHQTLYGTAYLKPKHHWMLDVPAQVVRDGIVLDAFVIERTHLRVKAIAEHIDNTTTFERSVLGGLCSVMVHDSVEFTADGLLGKTAVWPGFSPMVTVAGRMLIFGFEVSEDDVVLCGSALGIVLACAQQETELFVVVATLTHVRNITDHSLTCSRSDGRAVWRACEVVQALAWQEQAGGVLHIVRR